MSLKLGWLISGEVAKGNKTFNYATLFTNWRYIPCTVAKTLSYNRTLTYQVISLQEERYFVLLNKIQAMIGGCCFQIIIQICESINDFKMGSLTCLTIYIMKYSGNFSVGDIQLLLKEKAINTTRKSYLKVSTVT